jgi:hypothetical protein
VKDCKRLASGNGYRLSSNAFKYLNQFVITFLQCIGRQVATLLKITGVTPWNATRGAILKLLPASELWLKTCESQSTKIVINSECERVLQQSILPSLSLGYGPQESIFCMINDVVQWMIMVTFRVAERKGLKTVRKTEILTVVQKAPIFENLRPFLDSSGFTTKPEYAPSPSSLDTVDAIIPPNLVDIVLSPADSTMKPGTLDTMPLPDFKLVAPSTADSPKFVTTIEPAPIRIVACTDPSFSWIKTTPHMTGHFMESRGIETESC